MSTAVIIGIVVLLGGIVGVFLYLRAQKRKETERKRQEEAERRRQEEAARKAKEEAREAAKEAAKEAEAKTQRRIKAMKAESDAKIARLERSAREAEKRRMERPRRLARLERSAREAEKRRMERPRRQETPAGTKEERRNFREMLLMIATILFKPPPGISGGAPTDENIRKTKQVLATIRAGTADKETVKRWKSAWKLAKIKIRQRKEKGARQRQGMMAKRRARQQRDMKRTKQMLDASGKWDSPLVRVAEKRRMERSPSSGPTNEEKKLNHLLRIITRRFFPFRKRREFWKVTEARLQRDMKKTKQILAAVRAGTADKKTLKKWIGAWKFAYIKVSSLWGKPTSFFFRRTKCPRGKRCPVRFQKKF
jgi:hypothetical protein